MKKRKLKSWVKKTLFVAEIVILLAALIMLAGDCDSMLLFISSKIIGLVLALFSVMINKFIKNN